MFFYLQSIPFNAFNSTSSDFLENSQGNNFLIFLT